MTKSKDATLIKEEISSDDNWQNDGVDISSKIMKKVASSAVNIVSSPNLSSNSVKRKKKKKDYRRNDHTEEREIEEPQSAVYSQDIIDSSQSTVSTENINQSANWNCETNIIRKQISEPVDCELSEESQSVEFSRNAPESYVELGKRSSRDHLSKVLKKKVKKKSRLSFTADSETDSDQDCDVVENENRDHQNYVESNRTDIDESRRKTRLKRKRKRSSDTTLIDIFSPVKQKHVEDHRRLSDNFNLDGVTKSGTLPPEVSVQDSNTEIEVLKKDRKLKSKRKAEKRRRNSLLAAINDSTSHSDSDEDEEKGNPSSERILKKEELRKHSKRKVSETLSVSDNEEENRNLIVKHIRNTQFKAASSNRNKTSDDRRSESEKNDTRCPENDEKSLKLREKIKSEKHSEDTTPSCGLQNISVDDVKTEPELLEETQSNEVEIKVEKKRPNTLLAILHDGTSSSDSENETKRFDNSSGKSPETESRVNEILPTSHKKEKYDSSNKKRSRSFIASSESDNGSNHRSGSDENGRKGSKEASRSFSHKKKRKSGKLSAERILLDSPPKISARNVTELKVLRNDRRHSAKEKSKNLLAIIHNSTSSSDFDDESKKSDDSSAEFPDMQNLMKSRKTSETHCCVKDKPSDEDIKMEPDVGSEDQEHPVNQNVKERESSTPTRVNQRDSTSSDSDDEKMKTEDSETTKEASIENGRNVKKRGSSSVLKAIQDGSTSSDSDDDKMKIEDSDTTKEASVENERNVEKRGSSNLLKAIQDGSTSSDSDDEKMKIEESDTSEEVSVEKPPKKHSENRKFDLDVEAKDVEQMIIALREEEQVPSDTVRKLQKLRIKFRHTVPPQHQVETVAGSRAPSKKQIAEMEKFGPIKRGLFTPEEDTIIVNNWKAFCKMHDWDVRNVQPFLYMRHLDVGFVAKFSERIKFVQFLADGLPWRTLYSVYWRFRNLYQPHLQTKYSAEEDNIILAHLENSTAIQEKNVRKFSELAKVLNRTRASVWRRYRLLKKNRDPHKRTEWDLDLVKKVIKGLMKLTLSKDVSQLKDLDIPLVVWKKLSKELKIDHEELKKFWLTRLHMQLFCKEPVYLNDVKIKLIEFFYTTGINEWWEIKWPNVAKHFEGMTSLFLSQTFNLLIHDEKLKGKEFSEIMDYLYEVRKPQLQKNSMDKSLPRIVFRKGAVKLID